MFNQIGNYRKSHPEYAKAYHLRGLVHEKSADNQADLKDFDRAIGFDRENGAACYSRANLHSKMGNEDRATEDIEMVNQLATVNIETFANENNIWRSPPSNWKRLEILPTSWIGRTE